MKKYDVFPMASGKVPQHGFMHIDMHIYVSMKRKERFCIHIKCNTWNILKRDITLFR